MTQTLYPEARMIKPMLIWKLPENKEDMLSEICSSGEYFGTKKVDGFFYQFEKTEHYSYLFSRSVSKTTGLLTEKSANVPHIIEALQTIPKNTTLIGEIYYPHKTSKDVTKIMGCLSEEAIKRQINNPIHYYIHDIIMYDGIDLTHTSAINRYKILEKIYYLHNLDKYNYLELVDMFDTNIERTIYDLLDMGEEGAVLRKKTSFYEPDKRPAWSTIKVKKNDSIDLVCTGFCPPTKEYTGKEIENWEYWIEKQEDKEIKVCGKLYNDYIKNNLKYQPITKYYYYDYPTAMKIGAYDDNDKLIELGTVSSGLTDLDKQLMKTNPENYLNHVFSFKCMEIDKEAKTLRHPALLFIREDKNPLECKINEIFI